MRAEKGFTQKQVARLIGCSNQTICAIERWPEGRRMPPSAALYAAAFGFSLIESCTYELAPLQQPARKRSRSAAAA
jgi:transcriptional regulator with XRE-family HTH domain